VFKRHHSVFNRRHGVFNRNHQKKERSILPLLIGGATAIRAMPKSTLGLAAAAVGGFALYRWLR
jgi:hypothetical protein